MAKKCLLSPGAPSVVKLKSRWGGITDIVKIPHDGTNPHNTTPDDANSVYIYLTDFEYAVWFQDHNNDNNVFTLIEDMTQDAWDQFREKNASLVFATADPPIPADYTASTKLTFSRRRSKITVEALNGTVNGLYVAFEDPALTSTRTAEPYIPTVNYDFNNSANDYPKMLFVPAGKKFDIDFTFFKSVIDTMWVVAGTAYDGDLLVTAF